MQEEEEKKSIIINISSRIIDLMGYLSIKPAELAREIGVSKGRVSNILTQKNNPDLEFCARILSKYRMFNFEWLVMGEGPMLKPLPFDKKLQPFDNFSQVQEEKANYFKQEQKQEQWISGTELYNVEKVLRDKIDTLEKRLKDREELITEMKYTITMQKEVIENLKENFSAKNSSTPTTTIKQ